METPDSSDLLTKQRELLGQGAKDKSFIVEQVTASGSGEDVGARIPADRLRQARRKQSVENLRDDRDGVRVNPFAAKGRVADVHRVHTELEDARRDELTEGHLRMARPLDHTIGRNIADT